MENKYRNSTDEEISKAFRDTARITKALQKGINEALLQHKLAGNPICAWKDNKVVWIAPEDIQIKAVK